MPELSELALGANQERRRILGLILKEYALFKLSGDDRIAWVLNALATSIEHDHREDNEQ